MRLALQMFTTFLASGATDVGKMLYIYRRDGRYVIAYHEFVKSIMLGDRKYYKESASPILNVFDCGIEKNSGHFTALRLLRFLVRCRGQNTPEGRGYFDIGRAAAAFEDIFDNTEDFAKTLDRLVQRQLVEVNTRSLESASAASHVRVTSSGWYYHGRLVHSFVYLDLVLQDTPLNDLELAKQLRDSVYKVDNLNDPEEDKVQRVNVRFDRVYRFIDYLESEEQAEVGGAMFARRQRQEVHEEIQVAALCVEGVVGSRAEYLERLDVVAAAQLVQLASVLFDEWNHDGLRTYSTAWQKRSPSCRMVR